MTTQFETRDILTSRVVISHVDERKDGNDTFAVATLDLTNRIGPGDLLHIDVEMQVSNDLPKQYALFSNLVVLGPEPKKNKGYSGVRQYGRMIGYPLACNIDPKRHHEPVARSGRVSINPGDGRFVTVFGRGSVRPGPWQKLKRKFFRKKDPELVVNFVRIVATITKGS